MQYNKNYQKKREASTRRRSQRPDGRETNENYLPHKKAGEKTKKNHISNVSFTQVMFRATTASILIVVHARC